MAAAIFAGHAGAASAQDDTFAQSYRGTLGGQRIGMTLCVQNGKVVQFSHYFYQSHLADIPLGGVVDPVSTVALKEPGGGAFSLHFVGNGSNGSAPLNFDNSVGLAGVWKGANGASLPVALSVDFGAGCPARGQWYREITSQSDAQFEARVQGFTKTVLAGDRAGTARHVHFPLTVNLDGKTIEVRTPADLDRRWDEIFAPLWLKALAGTLPHDLFVKPGDGAAMIGDGLVWFDEHGARTINAKPPS
jgi:hypothetical protein